MEVDRKHVAAVRTHEALGYTCCKGEAERDAMHGRFMQRLEPTVSEIMASISVARTRKARPKGTHRHR